MAGNILTQTSLNWLTVLVLCSTGCGGSDSRAMGTVASYGEVSPPWIELGPAVYACGQPQTLVLAEYVDSNRRQLRVRSSQANATLSQVQSASGAKFADANHVFWSKGDEATMSIAGQTQTCRIDTFRTRIEYAARAGVELIAMGNEPGWDLEMRGPQARLRTSLDGQPIEYQVTSRQDGSTQRYQLGAASGAARLDVTMAPCRDSMSGRVFDRTVTVVTSSGKELHGCGMVPRSFSTAKSN